MISILHHASLKSYIRQLEINTATSMGERCQNILFNIYLSQLHQFVKQTISVSSYNIVAPSDRHIEKESLTDYIAKKREMFLVQYSLGVKRDEMRKLEEIAQAEEKKLELAEQYLEEDAAMFDEFLKENDKNSVEAIKMYGITFFVHDVITDYNKRAVLVHPGSD